MFRTIRNTIQLFAQVLVGLADAINRNTEAVRANTATKAIEIESIGNIEKAVGQIQRATVYLAASEREHRERAGQRTEILQ